jgi:hypothetical protein
VVDTGTSRLDHRAKALGMSTLAHQNRPVNAFRLRTLTSASMTSWSPRWSLQVVTRRARPTSSHSADNCPVMPRSARRDYC